MGAEVGCGTKYMHALSLHGDGKWLPVMIRQQPLWHVSADRWVGTTDHKRFARGADSCSAAFSGVQQQRLPGLHLSTAFTEGGWQTEGNGERHQRAAC